MSIRSPSAPPHCPRCTAPPIPTRPAPSSAPHSPSNLILNPQLHGQLSRSNRHSISRGRLSTSRRIVNAPAPRLHSVAGTSACRSAHDTALRTCQDLSLRMIRKARRIRRSTPSAGSSLVTWGFRDRNEIRHAGHEGSLTAKSRLGRSRFAAGALHRLSVCQDDCVGVDVEVRYKHDACTDQVVPTPRAPR